MEIASLRLRRRHFLSGSAVKRRRLLLRRRSGQRTSDRAHCIHRLRVSTAAPVSSAANADCNHAGRVLPFSHLPQVRWLGECLAVRQRECVVDYDGYTRSTRLDFNDRVRDRTTQTSEERRRKAPVAIAAGAYYIPAPPSRGGKHRPHHTHIPKYMSTFVSPTAAVCRKPPRCCSRRGLVRKPRNNSDDIQGVPPALRYPCRPP